MRCSLYVDSQPPFEAEAIISANIFNLNIVVNKSLLASLHLFLHGVGLGSFLLASNTSPISA
jgi:hypothetical protein